MERNEGKTARQSDWAQQESTRTNNVHILISAPYFYAFIYPKRKLIILVHPGNPNQLGLCVCFGILVTKMPTFVKIFTFRSMGFRLKQGSVWLNHRQITPPPKPHHPPPVSRKLYLFKLVKNQSHVLKRQQQHDQQTYSMHKNTHTLSKRTNVY